MTEIKDTYKTVGIIYNPISGGGRSLQLTENLTAALREHDVAVSTRESRTDYSPGHTRKWLATLDLAFVCGGDGTLRNLLPDLAETGTPWYMLPAGHESLAARFLAMSRDTSEILSHLGERTPKPFYYALLGDEPFFSMASVGFDSWVLKSIGERSGPSSHGLYIRNILKSILSYHGANLKILLAAGTTQNIESGYCLIANTPAYARDVQFAPDATPEATDLYLSFQSNVGLSKALRVLLALSLRRSSLLPPMKQLQAQSVELKVNGDYPMQCDGDIVAFSTANPCFVRKSSRQVLALAAN